MSTTVGFPPLRADLEQGESSAEIDVLRLHPIPDGEEPGCAEAAGDVPGALSDADRDWALERADLYFGYAGYQNALWPHYAAAVAARQEGWPNVATEDFIYRQIIVISMLG